MPITALWDVSSDQPVRLDVASLGLERDLEGWIDKDPRMLPGNCDIVARQLRVDAGIVDLVALDPQGTLHVIEIKRGTLTRETIAQGLDYAACVEAIATEELQAKIDAQCADRHGKTILELLQDRFAPDALEPSQRRVALMIVGVGKDIGLERVITYPGQRGVDITVVSFEAFVTGDGRRIVSREVTTDDTSIVQTERSSTTTLTELSVRAHEAGIGSAFDILVEAGNSARLHSRVYKNSVMFAPPDMKYRALYTVWVQPRDGMVRAWVGNKVFEDFMGVSASRAAEALGREGWHVFDEARAKAFAAELLNLTAPVPGAQQQENIGAERGD